MDSRDNLIPGAAGSFEVVPVEQRFGEGPADQLTCTAPRIILIRARN